MDRITKWLLCAYSKSFNCCNCFNFKYIEMPNKDQYQIHCRNKAIRHTFEHYLQSGMPRMLAYAKTAEEYYMSDERVRKIVNNK